MTRRPGRSLLLPVLLFTIAGAVLGGIFSVLAGGRLQTPGTLSPQRWRTVSPALDETVSNPLLGRGSQVVDGALVIREHAFHAADVLIPQLVGQPARIELSLPPDGGITTLVLSTGERSPRTLVTLSPTHAFQAQQGGAWLERGTDGPWVVQSDATGIWLDLASGPVSLSPEPLVGLELTTQGEEARVAGLRVLDAAGAVLFAEDFGRELGGRRGQGRLPMAGALAGGLWGLAFALAVLTGSRGVLLPVVLAALPLLTLPLSESWWLQAVERLYLSRTPYWNLARAAVVLSMAPLGIVALLRCGLLQPRSLPARSRAGGRRGLLAWLGVGLVVTGLACRALSGWPLLLGLLGGLLVVAPALVARRVAADPGHLLLLDAPGLLALATLGWPLGLLPLLLWRLLLVAAAARRLLDHAPGLGANLLLALALGLPLSAELALRATYLGEGWRLERLSGEAASDRDWRLGEAYWSGACGPQDAARIVRVAWAGGSSTGGAYQFHDQPTAFFPAQVHGILCEELPPDTRLVSFNFGEGGRDSYTISRSIETLLDRSEADLMVLYVGVNDVMTSGGAMSRRARAERIERLTGGSSGVRAWSSRSRLLTGLGLLVRAPREETDLEVPEVPLPDAAENMEMVAAATARRGTTVLLLTELLRSDFESGLADYAEMQQAVAAEHSHVHWFDLERALLPHADADLMADRNHLSRQGGALVALLLRPEIARLAQLGEQPAAGARTSTPTPPAATVPP